MKLKKIIATALSAVLALSVFTACGKKETASGPAVKVIDIELTEEEYALGVDKDQPELLEKVNEFITKIQEDGTYDEILNRYFGDGEPQAVVSAQYDSSKDQLVIATNAAFEPFEFTKGDSYLGIDMEIAKLFADSLGKELVIQNMDFDAVCLSVGQHKCDLALAGLTIKPDREEYVTFSKSYYKASQKIIVPADCTEFDNCKTAADVEKILRDKKDSIKVGVQTGTTGQFYAEGDESWGFEGFDFKTVGYKNGALAVQDLVNGNLDYVIIDSAPAACITESINEMQ